MPQATLQHITPQAHATGTVRPDSVTSDSNSLTFTPHYTTGFPPLKGNDTTVQHIVHKPILEVPTKEKAESYKQSPLHDTSSMALLLLSVFSITISYQKGYKYIENFLHNMFSVRKRENLFDDHTVNETGIMSALIFNTCVLEGILAFYAIGYLIPTQLIHMAGKVSLYVGLFVACALAFYLLQIALYYVLGFTFSDKLNTKIWISGYKASQSLLGLLLFPVTVVLLVYPTTIKTTLTIALSLYLLARLVFIGKGFRIFFNNLTSSVYFILYLCAVEIVPPVLTCVGAINLCYILQS